MRTPPVVLISLVVAAGALIRHAEGQDVACKDLAPNAPAAVRLAVCGDRKSPPSPTELEAKQHAAQLQLLSRQLAQQLEGAAWCGHVARPPAPSKACFASKPQPAPLCARADEVLADAIAALRTMVSPEVAALIAPGLANEVASMLGRMQQPPTKEVAESARKMARATIDHLAQLKAEAEIRAQVPKLEPWKVDVRAKELAQSKTRELAEAEARAIYKDTPPSTRDGRRGEECDAQLSWLARLERMQVEAKRLLTGSRAASWHKLATSVSAASTNNTRDYHDTYLLADALTAEDGGWLDKEIAESAKNDRTPRTAVAPQNVPSEDANKITDTSAPAERDAGIEDPFPTTTSP